MLGERVEVRVSSGLRKDGGVTLGDLAAPLSLERVGHHRRSARGITGSDEAVDEGEHARLVAKAEADGIQPTFAV